MSEYVLDASAVIATILDERGAEQVKATSRTSRISAVNLTEVVQKLVELGATDETIADFVRKLPCVVEPFDAATSVHAGLLRRTTRSHGLSLGDRACLALAAREGLPAMTGDRAWADVDVGVEVVLIR